MANFVELKTSGDHETREREREFVLAERDFAGCSLIAEGGVEAAEPPHSRAMWAALWDQLLVAGGVVAEEVLQSLARERTLARGLLPARGLVRAAAGECVLQAIHCLA